MDFEIELIAKTTDEGGLLGSFDAQLAELGGSASLVSEVSPYRVDSGNGFYFEARRVYRVSLTETADES